MNCLCAHERVIFVSKHQNNTQVSTQLVRQESTYLISFLTRHNEPINGDEIDDLGSNSI